MLTFSKSKKPNKEKKVYKIGFLLPQLQFPELIWLMKLKYIWKNKIDDNRHTDKCASKNQNLCLLENDVITYDA